MSKKEEQKSSGTFNKPEENEFLIITGMSGAGRSTTVRALEDQGWYVVGNIPPQLVQTLADLVNRNTNSPQRMAVILDVRSQDFFPSIQKTINFLRSEGVVFRVLFLDSQDQSLVQRFEQGRRPHPLQGQGRISDGINIERELLAPLKDEADLIIDTSNKNASELKNEITELFSDEDYPVLNISLMSFGFKYGIPIDSNFVADVRFIPNPHWVETLRPQTGLDRPVADYVLSSEGTQSFIDHYVEAVKPVFEGYRRENKHYATISIGCTGGKHRSVAVVQELAQRLGELEGVKINVTNRDLGRE